ncbi:MAG: hypothetical protein MUQ75_00255 [Crocinitomicaceae bacterium]|nr:hypothetical protein [Crocinitomicaceae bacterium]
MTYIWNRADRVDPKLMPKVIEDAFNKWTKEQYKNFKDLTEEEKNEVNYRVIVQMGKMNYNLRQLGYYKPALTKEESLNKIN